MKEIYIKKIIQEGKIAQLETKVLYYQQYISI